MKGKIYIPSETINDVDMDLSSYYSDANAYIKALEDSMKDSPTMHFEKPQKSKKTSYSMCKCEFYMDESTEATIDSLCKLASYGDPTTLIIKLDFDAIDEDFVTEFKLWLDTHVKISNNQYLTPREKENNIPTRDLMISFPNLRDEETFISLEGCKIVKMVWLSSDSYEISIERINFSNNI